MSAAGKVRWRRRAAFHEVGHAVANVVLGHQCSTASVYDAPRISAIGLPCFGEVLTDPELIYPAIEIAVSCLAGPIAEARYTKRSLISCPLGRGSSDFENAQAALCESRFTYADAERQAHELVTESWQAIEATASALIVCGTVGQGTLALICSGGAL
ncbi:MAG: hypothetical protein JO001_10680 [Alphaproteobacteria bacterium]|nr:hypothetical protein [Alphaproteobacteria bacterium]